MRPKTPVLGSRWQVLLSVVVRAAADWVQSHVFHAMDCLSGMTTRSPSRDSVIVI